MALAPFPKPSGSPITRRDFAAFCEAAARAQNFRAGWGLTFQNTPSGLIVAVNRPVLQAAIGGGICPPVETYLDATYSGEHSEAARSAGATEWAKDGVAGQGFKVTVVTGEAYYDGDGDQTWYEYRQDLTFDACGRLTAASAEYRVTVAVPENCDTPTATPTPTPTPTVAPTQGGNDVNTLLLLHCDGVDASTTFTDSSASAHTMTAQGNAQLDTAQQKFGTASGLFDGTGDYVSTPDHADWDFGTGDFSIEAWVRIPLSVGSVHRIASQGSVTTNNGDWCCGFGTVWGGGTKLNFATRSGGATHDYTSSAVTINADTWYHVAFARASGQLRMWLDGVEVADVAAGDALSSGEPLYIGARDTGAGMGEYMDGWFDEIRISNIARWPDGNFTPPTGPYD